MNFVILKNTIKRNWKLMLVSLAVLCFYLSVILYLVDPADMEKVKDLFGMIGGMLDAFGINTAAMTSPLAYTASTFFSVLVMAFTILCHSDSSAGAETGGRYLDCLHAVRAGDPDQSDPDPGVLSDRRNVCFVYRHPYYRLCLAGGDGGF